MLCQTIINDFQIARKMTYILDDNDFNAFKGNVDNSDELLQRLQGHELFQGRLTWRDLDIRHFHVMIINILKMLGNMNDAIRADKNSAPVQRLAFFLCGLVISLQEKTESRIELLKVNRVEEDNVIYDYTATLDINLDPPQTPSSGLKVIIDNEDGRSD